MNISFETSEFVNRPKSSNRGLSTRINERDSVFILNRSCILVIEHKMTCWRFLESLTGILDR